MSAPVWRKSLEVPGFDLEAGQEVPVVVGLVETAAGGVQVALRIGEGQLVILRCRWETSSSGTWLRPWPSGS